MLISYQYRLFSVMRSVYSFILFLPDHGFIVTDDVFLFYLKIGASLTVRSFVQIPMSDLFLGEASLPDLSDENHWSTGQKQWESADFLA